MTETSPRPVAMSAAAPPPPSLKPPPFRALRTIGALVLREMGSTYGRSPGGYAWALISPIGAITILALAFSVVMRHPPLGTSFILFFATGYLPFEMFGQLANRIGNALRYSRPLLAYSSVTWIDAVLGRFVLNTLREVTIFCLLVGGILLTMRVPVVLDLWPVATGLVAAALLGFGVGLVNCVLMTHLPVWDVIWGIISRPLFLASGVFFVYEGLPPLAQDILWWNPLIHVTGWVRTGFYPNYHANYVSLVFVFGLALVLILLGLIFLRSGYRAALEN